MTNYQGFTKPKAFSKIWIILIIGIFLIIISIVGINLNRILVKDSTNDSTKINQNLSTENSYKSTYRKGVVNFNNRYYDEALANFKLVDKTDPDYNTAQSYIESCENQLKLNPPSKKQLEEENKKNEAKKEKLKEKLIAKYTKITGVGYLYEIKERLQRENFYLTSSKFETAPDGSTGVRETFKKNIDGLTVEIWLQSAYSISYHYRNVSVY